LSALQPARAFESAREVEACAAFWTALSPAHSFAALAPAIAALGIRRPKTYRPHANLWKQCLPFCRSALTAYPEWNDELDASLRNDFEGDYEAERVYILYAYQYRP
jgi:hypothetical protein